MGVGSFNRVLTKVGTMRNQFIPPISNKYFALSFFFNLTLLAAFSNLLVIMNKVFTKQCFLDILDKFAVNFGTFDTMR